MAKRCLKHTMGHGFRSFSHGISRARTHEVPNRSRGVRPRQPVTRRSLDHPMAGKPIEIVDLPMKNGGFSH